MSGSRFPFHRPDVEIVADFPNEPACRSERSPCAMKMRRRVAGAEVVRRPGIHGLRAGASDASAPATPLASSGHHFQRKPTPATKRTQWLSGGPRLSLTAGTVSPNEANSSGSGFPERSEFVWKWFPRTKPIRRDLVSPNEANWLGSGFPERSQLAGTWFPRTKPIGPEVVSPNEANWSGSGFPERSQFDSKSSRANGFTRSRGPRENVGRQRSASAWVQEKTAPGVEACTRAEAVETSDEGPCSLRNEATAPRRISKRSQFAGSTRSGSKSVLRTCRVED